MSSAGNSSSSGASTRSSASGSTPAQTTPLPQTSQTPTPTPLPAQPTPTPISNTPTPTPTPTPPTTQLQQTTPQKSPAPSSTGWGNVPLDPGDHHGGKDHDDNGGSQTMQIVIPIVSTIAAVIFLVGAYRLVLYLRHKRQQKTSAPLPPPRIPNMLARQSVLVDNYRQSVMMDYDTVPPLLSASTSGHDSLQGSSRTVSTIGGRSPLLVNDQPITAGATPFPTSSASSSTVPSEDYDYTKPIPRRPRPVSLANSANRQSVFSIASHRNSVHGIPHRTSLRGAPHQNRIDIVLPEPLGPTSGLNQTTYYPPRVHRPSHVPVLAEMGGLQPMRHPPPSSRTSSRLRSYTPEDYDNESVTSPSSSHHHTQEYNPPPVPPLPPTLTLSPFLTPDTPLFDSSALTLPSPSPSSPPTPNNAAAALPVVTTTTDTTRSASNETPNASSSLPSPAESSSPTTLTTTER